MGVPQPNMPTMGADPVEMAQVLAVLQAEHRWLREGQAELARDFRALAQQVDARLQAGEERLRVQIQARDDHWQALHQQFAAGFHAALREAADDQRLGLETTSSGLRIELRAEIRETADQLRAEIRDTADQLRAEIRDTAEQLRAEIHSVATLLRGELLELRASHRQLLWAIMAGMATTIAGMAGLLATLLVRT